MGTWLFYNTLWALPLALVALLVRRLPRVRPGVEHLLWLLVLVRLVLPPLPAAAAVSVPATQLVASGAPTLGDRVVARTTSLLGPSWSVWGAQVLLAAFLSVLTFVVVRELRRAWAVERCVRRAAPADARLRRRVEALARSVGAPVPRVRVSPEAQGPFLWSLRRPVLVLPAGPGPDRTVLAHELAHLSRRDHWTSWLELVVQAFHFWNPLFWLARRQLHRAAELACDHRVLERFPARRRAFAEALMETAERSAGSFVPRAAQAIGMDVRDFEERLLRILRPEGGPGRALAALGRAVLPAGMLCAVLTLPGLVAPSLADFRAALPEIPAGIDEGVWTRALERAEARLAADPDDPEAIAQRGLSLLGLGRARAALEAFRRQEELGHEVGKALYNSACAWVRLGDRDRALECLAAAAALGLDVVDFVARDPDLAPLRGDPRVEALRVAAE